MIRVGTSGWIYREWRGVFYPATLPQTRWFSYFAGQFDTACPMQLVHGAIVSDAS